ncbi:hypothetical protein LJR164_002872 [Phenylobacterium sp. LjRoot164]|uniref:hypothetical protein n=1 Tax=unclassified Phenylobacterium TaxID=2640670 RepID=UPI003ED08DC3
MSRENACGAARARRIAEVVARWQPTEAARLAAFLSRVSVGAATVPRIGRGFNRTRIAKDIGVPVVALSVIWDDLRPFLASASSGVLDRSRVKGALPDNLAGLMDLLPVLRTGEAIIAGEAARLPVRCRVTLPSEAHLPRSADPEVTAAWSARRRAEGYDRVVASWRAQSTTAVAVVTNIQREAVEPEVGAEG